MKGFHASVPAHLPFLMTTDFHYAEVDERGFVLFMQDGIEYFLASDPILNHSFMIDYIQRLHRRWQQMDNQEKEPFHQRAREQMRALRRSLRSEYIFRSILHHIVDQDGHRNRNPTQQPQAQPPPN